MNYTEFKATYKTLLKKYPEISGVYETGHGITCITTRYEKQGRRWKKTDETTENINYLNYCNIFDAVPFFRALGGFEKVECSYTFLGYIPTFSNSINPSRDEKVTRKIIINR